MNRRKPRARCCAGTGSLRNQPVPLPASHRSPSSEHWLPAAAWGRARAAAGGGRGARCPALPAPSARAEPRPPLPARAAAVGRAEPLPAPMAGPAGLLQLAAALALAAGARTGGAAARTGPRRGAGSGGVRGAARGCPRGCRRGVPRGCPRGAEVPAGPEPGSPVPPPLQPPAGLAPPLLPAPAGSPGMQLGKLRGAHCPGYFVPRNGFQTLFENWNLFGGRGVLCFGVLSGFFVGISFLCFFVWFGYFLFFVLFFSPAAVVKQRERVRGSRDRLQAARTPELHGPP